MPEKGYYVKEFKNIYRIFVGSLLGIILISQIIIQYYISNTKNDASVVNIADIQRMRSQDIAKTVLNIRLDLLQRQAPDEDIRQLKSMISEFDRNHEAMLYGKNAFEIWKNESAGIPALIHELQKHYLAISLNARLIAHNPDMDPATMERRIQPILSNEPAFLQTMEKLLFTYNQEALKKTRQLQVVEVVLAFFTFLLVILEMFFLYRPLINRLQKRNRALQAQYLRIQHFMFVISHNIRRPVANLLGLAAVFDAADATDTEIITHIQESAKELDVIIRDLNNELSRD